MISVAVRVIYLINIAVIPIESAIGIGIGIGIRIDGCRIRKSGKCTRKIVLILVDVEKLVVIGIVI